MLGLVNTKNRNLFDEDTYTEKRPEYSLYVQDDFRATNRLTLNLGPALGRLPALDRGRQSPVELRRDDRQVRRRLGRRGDCRRQGRPLPPDLLEARLRPALRLRLRPHRQRPDGRARRLRDLLELHARRHVVVEGAEPAVPPVDRAQRDAVGLRRQPAAQGRSAAASRDRSRRGRRPGRRGRSSTSTSATRTRGSGTSTSSSPWPRTTWWRSPTSARRAGRC